MSRNIELEYIIEKKEILSLENGEFKHETVPNDYTYMVRSLYKDGSLTSLDNYPMLKRKIGLKVALMRLGIVFKEIIVKNFFGSYTSIIYNDYLNVYYTATSFSEDVSLYMAYRKAICDITQSTKCKKSTQNNSVVIIEEKEVPTQVDYVYNKFCQDIEFGLISSDINAVDLGQDDVIGDFRIKYYELNFELKRVGVHFVLGTLINKYGEVISEKVYFDKDLTTAVDKVYFSILDDVATRQLNNVNIDWTKDIDYKKIFDCCFNIFLDKKINSKINIKKLSSEDFKKVCEYGNNTKSLIDFYKVNKISFMKINVYVYDMYVVNTGLDSFIGDTFSEKVVTFEKSNDIYWRNLTSRLNKKIEINYIGD